MDLSVIYFRSAVLLLIVFNHNINFNLGFNLESRIPVIKRGSVGSYFGYSVAEHQAVYEVTNKVEHSWMLVGAPLGQNLQPNTTRSGALWKCNLTSYEEDCEQVITDGKRTIDSAHLMPPLEDEIKNGQWLGVTVRSQGPGKKVLVCAHRYIKQGADFQWGTGLCYTLSQRLDYDNAWEPCKGRSTNKAHEEYGYCQVGTSGVLVGDDTVVLGTPGPYTWRGTVFVLSASDNYLDRDKTFYMGPVTEPLAPVDKYSYLGMSVTAANFFGSNMSYAAGAPRANGTGKVVLFSIAKRMHSTMNVNLVIDGEQFASSFGYEIATADVNGDLLPDLLVGAPFYFDRDVGGAIYIYLNNKERCLNCAKPTKMTGKPESRYGFAITNLGDINKDGYDDIAVGAPYEDNGVVYVYLGSKNGLITEPSQVIKANDVKPLAGIRTFGYSLSGGMDLDQNGYPDLLIGAYESDAAILLRSRPIVGLVTSVAPEANLHKIDPLKKGCFKDIKSEYTCFTFDACVMIAAVIKDIKGSRLGEGTGITLRYKLEADFKRKVPRVWIGGTSGEEPRPSTVENDISLTQDKNGQLKHCHEHTVYIKENTRDIQSAIMFRLSYTLVQKEPRMPKRGAALPSVDSFPILNQQEAAKVFAATFLKDCGDNDICESQLFVEAGLELPTSGDNKSSWQLVLGEHEEVLLKITAHNLRESAYEAQLFVSHPAALNYIGRMKTSDLPDRQPSCNPHNNTLVICSLGNPLKQDASINVHLRFDPKPLADEQSAIEFRVFANTTSQEVEPEQPLTLKAVVVRRAEISLQGLARPEQVFYGGQVRGESAMQFGDEVGSRVLHTYQVFNRGPWKVSRVEVHLEWPFQVANNKPQGKWLLYLDEKPTIEALNARGECHMAPGQVNPLGLHYRPNVGDTLHDTLALTTTMSATPVAHHNATQSDGKRVRLKRDTEMVVKSELVSSDGRQYNVVNMNCTAGTAKCIKFRCEVEGLLKNQEATIFIKARLWNATLVEDYPRVDYVKIGSRARIVIPPPFIVHQSQTEDDIAEVVTVAKVDLHQQRKTEPIPLWIIILAIVLGLILLVLLTLLLWKCGFFKRRHPDPTLSGNLEKHVDY
ncbi:integrin alpha-PS1 isoform X2 [Nilaparvata lugens]|uniref:integrin alpha-PS1 isoform X2 n=1 Tax=Nilaparvata lugens TaxID=108931 RepID=UPI00193DE043|nr:integrin alpha-PS1 isoform X2 [Nilaparvata lugens]